MSLQIELNKDDFVPPPGWKWDSKWYISPELRYFTFASNQTHFCIAPCVKSESEALHEVHVCTENINNITVLLNG